jgi:hypothetical protein
MSGWSQSTSESGPDVLAQSLIDVVRYFSFGVFYLNQSMPFGGVKASGHGRFGEPLQAIHVKGIDVPLMTGGPEGLRGLCSIKAVTEDRFFKWIRTSIPVPVGKSHHCYVCTSFDPCSVLSRLPFTGS